MLGGLWGVMPSALERFEAYLTAYTPEGYYGEDQEFLAKTIYRELKDNALVHDSFFLRDLRMRRSLPKRITSEYCGESYDEREGIDYGLRVMLEEYENQRIKRLVLQLKSKIKQIGRV
jgi:hypothetical protein